MITIDELKAKLGGMKTAVDDLRDALFHRSQREASG